MFCTSRAKLARLPLYCLLFLRSARYPQMPRILKFLREFWPMPLPLLIHPAHALFAQRTRIPTSARSIGFCVIWVCISSSSSSKHFGYGAYVYRRGRPKKRSSTESQNRSSAHPDKNTSTDRQTDRPTDRHPCRHTHYFVARDFEMPVETSTLR